MNFTARKGKHADQTGKLIRRIKVEKFKGARKGKKR